MMKAQWRRVGLLVLVSLFPLMAIAQSSGRAGGTKLNVYAVGGKGFTTWHGQATAQSINFEWTRRHSKRIEAGIVAGPHFINQSKSWFGNRYGDGNETVRALSASILIRRRFERDSKTLQPYVEGSIGPMWAEMRVPAATSRFNLITQIGAGVVFMPERHVSLLAGYRFAHISNSGYSSRNPGLNVTGLLLGVRLRRSGRN